jgi:hypothetical protein
MNSRYDYDYSYQGITFDERQAIRQLFSTDDDRHLLPEPSPGTVAAEGAQQ